MSRIFGEIPGVQPGDQFASRADVAKAGTHRPLQAGISGGESEGADSIVISGGYVDDEDYGEVILYTGHGGQDPVTKRQIAHQELRHQNLALARSADQGFPVRVVRGSSGDPALSPASGYRYDGLYFIESYGKQKGRDNYDIWRFRLVRSPTENPLTNPSSGRPPSGPPQHYTTVQRLVRNTAVTQWVKELYDHTCQVCDLQLQTPSGPYAEGAYVKPVGSPHHGPDSAENVLCLCPNHHVLFERGVIGFDGSFAVLSPPGGRTIGRLTVHPKHGLDPAHAHYHFSMFVP